MSLNSKTNRRHFVALAALSAAGLLSCQTTAPISQVPAASPPVAALTSPPSKPSPPSSATAVGTAKSRSRNERIEGGVAYYYSDGAFPPETYILPHSEVEAAWDGNTKPPPFFQLCPPPKYRIQAVEKSVREERNDDTFTYWGENEAGDPDYEVWCKIPGARWFRAEQYFSPERPPTKTSSTKKVSDIRVILPEDEMWVITVEGKGTTGLRGKGPSLSEKWDGTANGRPLPDGEYTLLLTINNDHRMTQTVKVTIDTKPPEVTDSHVYAIEGNDESEDLDYTIRFKLEDPPAADGTHSGLKEGTAKLDKVNVPYTLKGRLMRLPPDPKALAIQQTAAGSIGVAEGPEGYELVAKVPMGDVDDEQFDKFEYQIYAEDWAGNRSHAESGVAAAAVFAGTPTEPILVSGLPVVSAYNTNPTDELSPPAVAPPAFFKGVPPIPPIVTEVAVAGGAVLPAARIIRTGINGAILVGNIADITSQALLDLGDDFKSRRLVPADDSYDLSQINIQDLRGRTPFLCPQGQPLRYPFKLWIANRDTLKPEVKVPAIAKLRLPVTVTFQGENLRGSGLISGSQKNTEVWFRKFYYITNWGETPQITWDGRRHDDYGLLNDGKIAPSGNYRVSIRFGGRSTFASPNQKKVLAGLKAPLLTSEETLIGFRVINNLDMAEFGPPGNAKEALADVEDVVDNQDHPKDPGFAAWTSYIGPAGVGKPPSSGQSTHDWHHLVEQNQNQFLYRELNRPYNLVRIPHTLHLKVSTAYGKPQPEWYPSHPDYTIEDRILPLRTWLKLRKIGFERQRFIGIQMMRKFCRDNGLYKNGYGIEHQTSVR